VWVKLSVLTVQKTVYILCEVWVNLSLLTVQKTACFLYKFWYSFQTVLLQGHFAGIVILHTWGKERCCCVNWGYSEHVVLTYLWENSLIFNKAAIVPAGLICICIDCTHLKTNRWIKSFGNEIRSALIKRGRNFIFCTWVWKNIVEDYVLLEYDAVCIDEGLGEAYLNTQFESR
jgi:hypothetical protein